jgi:hypothetical protein
LDVDNRRDIDDASTFALGYHLADGCSAPVVITVQVCCQEAMPVFVGHFQKRLDHEPGCVVDPDVDPAEGGYGSICEFLNMCRIAGITLHHHDPASGFTDSGSRFVGPLCGCPVVEGYVRARTRQRYCHRRADPLGGTCNNCALARQVIW